MLAAKCKGMTGASLAGVARAAASHALERAVMDFSLDPAHHSIGNECLVTLQDLEYAVDDVLEKNANQDWEQDDSETDEAKQTNNERNDRDNDKENDTPNDDANDANKQQ